MLAPLIIVGTYLLAALAVATLIGVHVCRSVQPRTGTVNAHLLGGVVFGGTFVGSVWIGLIVGLLLSGLVGGGLPG